MTVSSPRLDHEVIQKHALKQPTSPHQHYEGVEPQSCKLHTTSATRVTVSSVSLTQLLVRRTRDGTRSEYVELITCVTRHSYSAHS